VGGALSSHLLAPIGLYGETEEAIYAARRSWFTPGELFEV
jgi:hypothetical protein